MLLGTLGASLTFSCAGRVESTGDGDGAVTGTGGSSGIVACTNPVDLGGGFFSCDEGYTHRPTASMCPSPVPRDEQIGDPTVCTLEQGCCQTDADCPADNQYCQYYSDEGSWCAVGCRTDADCGDSSICQCADPMGFCVAAYCGSDEDCPGDARCASFATDEGCGPWTRFSCQSVDDECTSSLDCAEGEECDGTGGVRQCIVQEFTCSDGRPFLVADKIRVAPLCQRLDWLLGSEPSLGGLSSAERAALASSWERAAQMEHASVAAFARFALQLLSLGAPADLIEQTHQALVDETEHAKLCFGLASAYRGAPVGPGPLDVCGSLADGSIENILSTTIVEGCIGETAAALEAAEAAALCEDEFVRVVLLRIADDESRHAELAWRFVRYALKGRPDLLAHVKAQFELALRPLKELSKDEPSPLAPYGVLSHERKLAIRREALQKIVAPCARHLLASVSSGGAASIHSQFASA